jgi:hypothetical protein
LYLFSGIGHGGGFSAPPFTVIPVSYVAPPNRTLILKSSREQHPFVFYILWDWFDGGLAEDWR